MPSLPPEVLANRDLRGRHAGKRAFIVCNGPTINSQDLLPLRNEIVFSVSNGYHHKHYLEIAPRYHCTPLVHSSSKLDRAGKITWLKEMEVGIGGAEPFFSYSEKPLIEEAGLFQSRQVRYLYFDGDFSTVPMDRTVEITGVVPPAQSVSIMCLMVAMYMGLNPIYLLGVEHDHFRTGRYDYFYEPTVLKGMDPSVTADGQVINPLFDEFAALYSLWTQYRHLKKIAAATGISIVNATAGGALDEFPRARLEDVLGAK